MRQVSSPFHPTQLLQQGKQSNRVLEHCGRVFNRGSQWHHTSLVNFLSKESLYISGKIVSTYTDNLIIKPVEQKPRRNPLGSASSFFLQKCSKSVAKTVITILPNDLGQFTLTRFLCLKNKVNRISWEGVL